MRILSIQGENIASLGRFALRLDQEPLASAGLFAIVGPTGAGKSSLLDALCLALYHDVPRLSGQAARSVTFESALGPAALGDVRHVVRRGATTAHAEVDFRASDGLAYRCRWGYRAARRKGASPQEETWLQDLASGQILAHRKTDCAARIRALIGLDFGQFTRTVLLAQGQFAAFLQTPDPDQRTLILEQLTGTELYTRLGRAIADRKRTEDERLGALTTRRQGLTLLDDTERARLAASQQTSEHALQASELPSRALEQLQGLVERAARGRSSLRELSVQLPTLVERLAVAKAEQSATETSAAAAERDWLALQPELDRANQLDASLAAQQAALQPRHAEQQRRQRELRERQERLDRDRAALTRHGEEQATLRTWLEAHAGLAPLAREQSFVVEQLGAYLTAHRRGASLQAELATAAAELPTLRAELNTRDRELATLQTTLAGIDVANLATIGEALARRAEQLELRDEESALRAQLAAAEGETTRLRAPLAAAQSLWERARIELELGGDVSRDIVAQLRAKLEQGQPCPVCGATEHPFRALTEELLRARVEGLRRALTEAEQHRSQLVVALQRQTLFAERAAQDLARVVARQAALSVPAEIVDRCRDRDELQRARALYHEQGKAQQRLQTQRLEREQRHTRWLELDSRASRLRQQLTETSEQAAAAEGKLAPLWPTTNWRPGLLAGGEAFLRDHAAAVKLYAETTQRSQALAQTLERLALSIEAQIPELDAAQAALSQLAAELSEREQQLAVEREQRAALLGGQSVENTRARWSAALSELRAAVRAGELRLRTVQDEHTRLEARLAALTGELNLTEAQLAAQGPDCVRALAPLSLAAPPPPTAFTPLHGEELMTWLRQSRQALQDYRDHHQRESGALRQRLLQDDEQRSQARELARQVAEQERVFGRWLQLHELFGQGDGKAFRGLAQQQSLEVLLDRANRRLGEITPRYTLRRLPDAMHFVVVDHDNYDAARPVHTLSGGESFIVSLALALALSALVSGDQALETLFIDEGFGSLDRDTLRQVMKALDALHAQGRKIGLVTHVEDMKEHIPTRVEVRRVAPGRSELVVVG